MTEKDAFVRWGCLNSYDWARTEAEKAEAERFAEAKRIHDAERSANPCAHQMTEIEVSRGYVEVTCSCGFGYSYDCGD